MEMLFHLGFVERFGLDGEDVLRFLSFGQQPGSSDAVPGYGLEQIEGVVASGAKPRLKSSPDWFAVREKVVEVKADPLTPDGLSVKVHGKGQG